MKEKIFKRLSKKEQIYVTELSKKGMGTTYEVLQKLTRLFFLFLLLMIVMLLLGLKELTESSHDNLLTYIISFIMVIAIAMLITPIRTGAKIMLLRLL